MSLFGFRPPLYAELLMETRYSTRCVNECSHRAHHLKHFHRYLSSLGCQPDKHGIYKVLADNRPRWPGLVNEGRAWKAPCRPRRGRWCVCEAGRS